MTSEPVADGAPRGRRVPAWTIGRRLAAGYALILVLMAGVGAVAFVNTQSLVRTSDLVDHSHVVLSETQAIVAALKDAEAGQRGYLVTGADAYLSPYTAARSSVKVHLEKATELTADNPAQQERLTALLPLVASRFAELQKAVDEYKDDGFEAAQEYVVADAGRPVMDQITETIDAVERAERELLEVRAGAAEATATTTTVAVLVGTAVAAAAVVLLGSLLTRGITRPINLLTARLREIADGDGDLTQRIEHARDDEVGALASVFNRFVENIATLVRQIGQTASTSSAAAQELSVIAADMTQQSGEAARQASVAAASAEQISSHVQTVAAAGEQMGVSIQEIARSASEASEAGRTAVTSTDEANASISRLGESSAAIGGVVTLINTIAQQTNLLALNATIEAARAGEAGKGFAVVAGEVKELAQQTAAATEEITARISQIQSDVEVAVRAIATTTAVIAEVNDHQGSIAGAVEEQSATTSAMATSVAEAAVGATSIADNVRSIAQSATSTVGNIDQVRTSADELARSSQHLDELVSRFRA